MTTLRQRSRRPEGLQLETAWELLRRLADTLTSPTTRLAEAVSIARSRVGGRAAQLGN